MKIKKWFWGMFFIIAGGLIIVNALGLYGNINILSLLLTIFLIAIIIESVLHLNYSGILIPLSLIGVIFSEELGITDITPWPIIITALLLSIGLEIMFGKTKKIFTAKKISHVQFDEIIDEDDSEEINYRVNFGSGIKYVNSHNLRKGYFSCNFGALKVYFDNAQISNSGAEIILDISFSGVELFIPKEWDISIDANTSLGGIEEKNRRAQGNGPKVIIKGNVSLSGVEIIYI